MSSPTSFLGSDRPRKRFRQANIFAIAKATPRRVVFFAVGGFQAFSAMAIFKGWYGRYL
ncbi:hypothetical protein D3C75_484790 [compost metagenome]